MTQRWQRLAVALTTVAMLMTLGATSALARPADEPVPNDKPYYGKWIYESSLPYTDVMDVTAATVDQFDVVNYCNSRDPGNTVWYRYRATSNVNLTLDTFGSSYDTEITVFSATGQYIDCNDDASDVTGNPEDPNNVYASYLEVSLQAGRTYLFRVSSYDNPAYCQTESDCAGVSDGALVFNVTETN